MLGSKRVLLSHKEPAAYIYANRKYKYQHAWRRISAEEVIEVVKGASAASRSYECPGLATLTLQE